MTLRTLLGENVLTSFMVVLLGLLTITVSLDWLWQIFLARSGARVIPDFQVSRGSTQPAYRSRITVY
jgi:hypothetical protein